MKHIKHFKKLKIFLLSASLLLSSGGGTICHCVRYKENFDGKTFTFINDRKLTTRIERLRLSLQHRKDETPGAELPVLIGGRYGSVPHGLDYESHHLISNKFCEKYSNILRAEDAPSVLMLKSLHKFTGSYGGKSAKYLEKEEEAYRAGGLEAVLEFGIRDLNQVIANHYASYKQVSLPGFTPIKSARAAVQRIDRKAYPGQDLSAFITTPLKAKTHSRL